ncbi:MAG: hypothetical protein WC916_02315 [Candidatus Woesearchaeota archaeon]
MTNSSPEKSEQHKDEHAMSHISKPHAKNRESVKGHESTLHKSVDDKTPSEDHSTRSFLITIGIIIGIILIMGAIFYSVKYTTDVLREKKLRDRLLTYNGYTFSKGEDDKWYTQMTIRNNTYVIPFYYNPKEAESVTVEGGDIFLLVKNYYMTNRNGKVYITLDPNGNASEIIVAGVEVSRILGNVYNIYNFNASVAMSEPLRNRSLSLDYPLITCKNQSAKTMVVLLQINSTATQNRIYSEKNCIILESTNATEAIRVADAFSYRLLSIIQ